MSYYKRLAGKKVYLSPICTGEIDTYMKWMNDAEVLKYTGQYSRIYSQELEVEALERLAKDGNHFAIIEMETDKLIGGCSFFAIDQLNRKAEVGIMIGEKDYWSKGYGRDALQVLLKYGFTVRNYNNICLRVDSFNARGIACYEKAGFKRQGVMREAVIRGNERHDLIYMDILASEYFEAKVSEESNSVK